MPDTEKQKVDALNKIHRSVDGLTAELKKQRVKAPPPLGLHFTGGEEGLKDETEAKQDLVDAIIKTVDYIGLETLPAIEGWTWFDALSKHAPEQLEEYLTSLQMPPRPDGLPQSPDQ